MKFTISETRAKPISHLLRRSQYQTTIGLHVMSQRLQRNLSALLFYNSAIAAEYEISAIY